LETLQSPDASLEEKIMLFMQQFCSFALGKSQRQQGQQ
jgi:hypothetical protein